MSDVSIPASVARPRASHGGAAPVAVVGRQAIRYVLVLGGAIAVWYWVSLRTNNPVIVPSPLAVARAGRELIADGTLAAAAATSLQRLLVGYGLAVVLCVPLGLLMGTSRVGRVILDPIVEMLRPISGIAWIPLALVILGVSSTLVIFIIVYGAAFPILINTADAVRRVDPRLLQVAETFGASRWAVMAQVVLPGAVPGILVGARIAVGTAWMSLVAAELVGASAGLGYSIDYFRQLLMSDRMITCILAVGVLGLLTNGLMRLVEWYLTPWTRA